MASKKARFKGEEEAHNYTGEAKEVDTDFSYLSHANPDRLTAADSAYPFLDDVEREQAEIRQAKAEDREPDLDNPPPTVGTPIAPTHAVAAQAPAGVVVEPDFTVPVTYGGQDDASRRSPEENLELENESRERIQDAQAKADKKEEPEKDKPATLKKASSK